MTKPTSDKVVQLREAFDKPSRDVKGDKTQSKKGGGAKPPPPGGPTDTPQPKRLPDDAPVKALGTFENEYFFITAKGELRRLKAEQIGRLNIISLFGSEDYLIGTWPTWALVGDKWVRKEKFDHGKLASILIGSCSDRPLWNPNEKVRGLGTWLEDGNVLVMHCGQNLYRKEGGEMIQSPAGLRGDLLYPSKPAIGEPLFERGQAAGHKVLTQLETWIWKRPELDPSLLLGWIIAAKLGQAPPWRPMIWITGGRGTGKSTLQKFIEWLLGRGGAIKPTDTTPAYLYQRIGDSALPVQLDEFEATTDQRVQQAIIKLARIAASGGEVGRGGSENNPKSFNLKNPFNFSSITMPPLTPADRSRMAICELMKRPSDMEQPEFDFEGELEDDLVLGSHEEWSRIGRVLSGRVLSQWDRYLKTFGAYKAALMRQGHDDRAAQQFGALGAGYDIALYDTLDPENVLAWAKMLPAGSLAETSGNESEPTNCLNHLLESTPDLVRHGTRESVSYYLQRAQRDMKGSTQTNDPDDAARVLAKMGIKLWLDARAGLKDRVWWIGVASIHQQLNAIYSDTHWKGLPNAPGAWAQALGDIEGAWKTKLRIAKGEAPKALTAIPWEAAFPQDTDADREEKELVL